MYFKELAPVVMDTANPKYLQGESVGWRPGGRIVQSPSDSTGGDAGRADVSPDSEGRKQTEASVKVIRQEECTVILGLVSTFIPYAPLIDGIRSLPSVR